MVSLLFIVLFCQRRKLRDIKLCLKICFLILLLACSVQLLQLWEKNGYFDEETIQQLQNPALGLGQYQVSEKTTSVSSLFFASVLI